jgi:hypothetical protein
MLLSRAPNYSRYRPLAVLTDLVALPYNSQIHLWLVSRLVTLHV